MNFKLSAFADEAGKNISEQITALRENGIEYLEIRGVDGYHFIFTTERADEVADVVDSFKGKRPFPLNGQFRRMGKRKVD